MDLHHLDQAVQLYYSAALTASTHKTYKAAERRYSKFCLEFSLQPFPASENVLCYYVACLGQQGLAHSTIKTYLSGVRQLQISMGLPEPQTQLMPRLRQVLKGVQVMQGRQGRAPRPRLPITPSILRKMRAVWEKRGDPARGRMMWAAATTTFFTFCRTGEVVMDSGGSYDPNSHLSYRDLSVVHKSPA